MKLNHKYRVESDFNNMSKTERELFTVVYKLYHCPSEDTQRLKKESLSLFDLFNCTLTICYELTNSPIAEIKVDDIWEDIKPPKVEMQTFNNFRTKRWYEATVIFSCVYVIIARDYPKKHSCLEIIKAKCAYDYQSTAYFNLFEPLANEGINIKENEKNTSGKEQSPNYTSWLLDDFKKTLSGLSIKEKFFAFSNKLKEEKEKETQDALYIQLLEQQVSYHRKQLSEEDVALPKEKLNSLVDVNHIISAVEQYFHADSIKMLQIIAYVMNSQRYADDVCETINAKIKILEAAKQASNVSSENLGDLETSEITPDKVPLKVKSVAIMELLKLLDKGTAHNDLTDICKFIGFITGNSHKSIYNDVQNGISFNTKHHAKDIERANELFHALNISISIDKQKQY